MSYLSIIIPTINRPDDLSRTLDCFLIQTYKSYEIIIIDQSDDNKSENISDIYISKWLNIRYNKFLIKSGAQARNFAIGLLDDMTDIVVFIDDDVTFDKNFLHNIYIYTLTTSALWWTWKINSPTRQVSIFKKIGLLLLWWWRNNNQQIVAKTWFNQLFTTQPDQEKFVQWMSGCGMRYRKSILDEWYYFPKNFFKYSIMEDLFLSYEIYRNYRDSLTYTPTIEMIHHESPNRSIPNYQKIRQHCIHRYIFHKAFWISILWYVWTIILLMFMDLATFRDLSIVGEYFRSFIYISKNKKNLNLSNWDYNNFIFDS